MNSFQKFIYLRTYSRWNDLLQRRENWEETVDRVVNFLQTERPNVPEKVYKKIKKYMLALEVLPSMRLVWTAGEAAKKNNAAIYNCAYAPMINWKSFADALYLLMSGCGFGFSVQEKYIMQLPIIKNKRQVLDFHIIDDSRQGWAESVRILMTKLTEGIDVSMDYSKIRKKGEKLKTFGGRSSGPEPLAILHQFIRDTFSQAQGRKLKDIECLDIMCQIAEVVVAGGSRRSSEICLFDMDSGTMLNAKSWPFPNRRSMSNNSFVADKKPTSAEFIKMWSILASSGTGEPGIFNLNAARSRCPERRDASKIEGVNPCGEAMLRAFGLCNLSSVILRTDDDLDDAMEKVETATWLGVIQSTFTDFPYIDKQWKANAEEERLLGVSLSGQMDNPSLTTPDSLKALKSKSIKVAKKAAKIMSINTPAAITTVKPEGTSSQMVNSSSGLHPRYSQYYIRRVRISATDPLCKMMKAQGINLIPNTGEDLSNVNTYVIEFPIKSPEHCVTRHDLSAIAQLEHYKTLMEYWCEHSASATIYVKENEWLEVGAWVYKNWDYVIGLTFLPADSSKYELAPYEEITVEECNKMIEEFPSIDYSQLSKFEAEDNTEGAKTFACSGDKCELN